MKKLIVVGIVAVACFNIGMAKYQYYVCPNQNHIAALQITEISADRAVICKYTDKKTIEVFANNVIPSFEAKAEDHEWYKTGYVHLVRCHSDASKLCVFGIEEPEKSNENLLNLKKLISHSHSK